MSAHDRFGRAWLRTAIAAWRQQLRDRCTLAELGSAQRRDLGLARDLIDVELKKTLWRA
jgi:uncharacterized protein YjiS (DUF1127 family)